MCFNKNITITYIIVQTVRGKYFKYFTETMTVIYVFTDTHCNRKLFHIKFIGKYIID